MVSETTFPERRTSLRAISRPSQLAFGVALLAVVSICATYGLLTELIPYRLSVAEGIALGLWDFALVLSSSRQEDLVAVPSRVQTLQATGAAAVGVPGVWEPVGARRTRWRSLRR
jgi:hypothetical protein